MNCLEKTPTIYSSNEKIITITNYPKSIRFKKINPRPANAKRGS